jgi:hypothetical protein
VVVGGAAAAVLVATGVPLLTQARYLAFEAVIIVLPGWLLYRSLITEPAPPTTQLAFGWSLGYLVEILAFIVASTLGVRVWLPLGPVAVAVIGLVLMFRGPARGAADRSATPGSGTDAWQLSGICSIALIYLAFSYFTETPLPGTVSRVDYYKDTVHHLSLAAEASHHWPISDPHVAGEPFSYYHFPFIHLAAASQMTGLDLPLVLFRLYIVPLIILLAIQSEVLGRTLGGAPAVGVLTAAFVFLVGEIDPWVGDRYPFFNAFFVGLHYSPTFLLGLVFFVPFVTAVAQHLAREKCPGARRTGLLLVLLLFGASGSKGQLLPLLAGSLLLMTGWVWLWRRRVDRLLLGLGLLAFAALGALYLYGQSRATSIVLDPLASVRAVVLVAPLSTPIALLVSLIGVIGIRVVGLIWAGLRVKDDRAGPHAWCLALILTALVPFYLTEMGSSQYYFLWFAYVVASGLAADAVYRLARRLRQEMNGRNVLLAAPVGLLLVVGLLDLPVDFVPAFRAWRSGHPPYSVLNDNLTEGLWQGLVWLREHSPTDAVIAVNNASITETGDWRYFYYSAFAERRVFLEGWMYSDRTHEVGYAQAALGQVHPFPERLALTHRLFQAADPEALEIMTTRYGVRYVLVDKVHGGGAPGLASLGRVVFSNADVDILVVERPAT